MRQLHSRNARKVARIFLGSLGVFCSAVEDLDGALCLNSFYYRRAPMICSSYPLAPGCKKSAPENSDNGLRDQVVQPVPANGGHHSGRTIDYRNRYPSIRSAICSDELRLAPLVRLTAIRWSTWAPAWRPSSGFVMPNVPPIVTIVVATARARLSRDLHRRTSWRAPPWCWRSSQVKG